ncbi:MULTISPECIES: efflux RND transporter permease subunit [unclassified Minwuia]|jgi:multidrug efflux pump subunit AcrB|uniref:efflux RND transporter permease subunit n=1 Tax=unclassified Minwuia TaxID=2618799 RepID=UPI0024787072|nr:MULTISPECIES: efflux RND transporter permease subunit [unclassified Minwuia]
MNPADLVRIFVRHPNAANLLMALMLIAGLFSLQKLNTQFFPDTGLDFITITVAWPGASAEDADSSIVSAIEPEVRFIDGVKEVNSYSQEGSGVVVVEFQAGSDMQSALSNVDAAVSGITTLPEDAEEPLIKRAIRYDLISRISISGPVSEATLKALAKHVRDGLLDRGIDLVNFFGKRDEEIHVDVPPSSLRRLDLTLGDLSKQISDTSVDLPSGDLSGTSEKQLRSLGELKRADEVAGIEVASAPNGEKIFLRDVAQVRESFDSRQPVGGRGENPAIEMIVQRSLTTDALEAAAIVNAYLEEIRGVLPPNIEIRQYDIQASLISDRINLLLRNGLSGLVLVLIVLFVFLSGRIAFWVAMGIPVAILATGAVMLWSGQSINMVSLFALIMTLGIIVDDAIVVGEHAAHLRQQGMSAVDAAEAGALRMLAPVTAAALTTIAAFMPLFAIGDVIGQIIVAIPLVVVAVLVASLIECFFVLPGHLRGAMRAEPGSGNSRYESFRLWFDTRFNQLRDGRFRRAVVAALDYRYVTIGAILAALIISLGILASGRVGFVFFPNPESDTIDANIEMAAGTPRENLQDALLELERALARAEKRVASETSDIVVMSFQRLGQSQGRSFERVSGDHLGGMQVELVASDYRNVRTNEFIEIWREEIPRISGVRRITLQERAGGPPGRELDIRFRGDDIAELKLAAEELKLELQRFDGLSDIEDDLPFGKQELILELTPRGRALGFTTDSVARQVRNAFEGAIAKRFPRDDEEVTIRVQLPEAEATEAAVRNLYLRSPSGAETPLEGVVSFREDAGFARIRRKDGRREVAIFAEIDETVTKPGAIITALSDGRVQAIAQRYNLSFRFAGKAEEQAQTLGDMKTGAMVGLSAIYIILAWVFASYSRPVIVMSIIPFGLIGAVTGHLILGYDITILSLVALIGLAGILVNNSIILVSTIDERVKDGQTVMEAIVDGACDRLRAVTLTSITTIVGLIPLLFETSLQAQFLIPMAVTIVFGLATASVLVLFVVPALLGMLEDISAFRTRIVRGWRTLGDDRDLYGDRAD